MIYDLFVVGGVAFYLLLLAFTLLAFWATEYDEVPGGTIALVIVFIAAWVLFGDMLPQARTQAWSLAWKIPAYLGLGLIWSLPRWIIFLKKALRRYTADRDAYLAKNEVRDYDDKDPHKPTPESWLRSYPFDALSRVYGFSKNLDGKMIPPSFARNRKRMINWVLLWPISIIWTFCRDVFIELTDWIIGFMGHTYQKISNWIFKGVE